MRLYLYISKSLGISRREAKILIKESNDVFVNKEVIKNPNFDVAKNDKVIYKQKDLQYIENVYILLNKPKGYICSIKDELYPSILNLISEDELRNRLKIVGRLDVDTEGLILLTDDGDFIHKMTSPKKDVEKKYYVEVDTAYLKEDIISFFNGVFIIDENKHQYKTKKALLEIIEANKAYLTITEGKFHQVKKMHKAIGKEVLFLKRESVGEFNLGNLKTGQYKIIDCCQKNRRNYEI